MSTKWQPYDKFLFDELDIFVETIYLSAEMIFSFHRIFWSSQAAFINKFLSGSHPQENSLDYFCILMHYYVIRIVRDERHV